MTDFRAFAFHPNHSSLNPALHSSWAFFTGLEAAFQFRPVHQELQLETGLVSGQPCLNSPPAWTELWRSSLGTAFTCLHPHPLKQSGSVSLLCSGNILLCSVNSRKVKRFHIYCFSLSTRPVTVKKNGSDLKLLVSDKSQLVLSHHSEISYVQ